MKDIFLCHTGADKDWTRALGTRLEEHDIRGRRIEVFFDEWDIDYGDNVIAKIDGALKQSRYIGIVLSPRMVQADWPNAEWQSQVMADPMGKRGRILPLLRHKFDPDTGDPIEVPFVLAMLKRFDFTRDKDFDREVERLVRKLSGLPPARGARRGTLGIALGSTTEGQEAADLVEEALPANLFAVLDVPGRLFSDITPVRSKREVWSATEATRVPPFVLHGDRLVSFVSPSAADNPFREFVTGTDSREERVADWMADVDLRRQLIGMFNSGLREHCYHMGIFTPKGERTRYYCPVFGDGRPREFRWGAGDSSSARSRTLAKMKARVDGTQFGVHMSASMRFLCIGDRVFLIVEPGWLFTTDGRTPLGGPDVGRYSTFWGGKERNAAVLRNVLMWRLLVAEGHREIKVNLGTEDAPAYLLLQSTPIHTRIGRGLEGDTIRLDRILGGDGAGEVAREEGHVPPESDAELDAAADLALLDAIAPDESEREPVADDSDHSGAHGPYDVDDEDDPDDEEELELPF